MPSDRGFEGRRVCVCVRACVCAREGDGWGNTGQMCHQMD